MENYFTRFRRKHCDKNVWPPAGPGVCPSLLAAFWAGGAKPIRFKQFLQTPTPSAPPTSTLPLLFSFSVSSSANLFSKTNHHTPSRHRNPTLLHQPIATSNISFFFQFSFKYFSRASNWWPRIPKRKYIVIIIHDLIFFQTKMLFFWGRLPVDKTNCLNLGLLLRNCVAKNDKKKSLVISENNQESIWNGTLSYLLLIWKPVPIYEPKHIP